MKSKQLTQRAFAYCESVTRAHARSFFFAARFLPAAKRRAIYPIYAFCRHVDDAVDEAGEASAESMRRVVEVWESRLRDVFGNKAEINSEGATDQDLVFIAWQDLLGRYRFDIEIPLDLVKGIVQDTEKNRFQSFDELYVYCYRVASTVGLMSAEILGYSDPVALENAEALGIAMQLTNILRDVREDAERDRIYLPREDLDRFGVTEEQIREGRFDRNFRDLMKFEVERAREYYRKGNDGIRFLERDTRLTVDLASTVYSKILDVIESMDYNIFNRRAATSLSAKLRCIPGAMKRQFWTQRSK